MMEPAHSFRFGYRPPVIRAGAGCIQSIGAEFEALGCDRVLVVCGRTVGQTDEVIEPVRTGLGEAHVGLFAQTTPEKRLETAIEGDALARTVDADALLAVGGGSSLDTAKQIAALSVRETPETALEECRDKGTFDIPGGRVLPIGVVPTTLAGADLSIGAGVNADMPQATPDLVTGGISDPRLMPEVAVYDPDLAATTPREILAGSAMNGFNKGIETIYSSRSTPITDATARAGLRRLIDSLPSLGHHEVTPGSMAPILEGIVLVQYGVSRRDGSTLSIIHAFGHGLSRTYDLQQGVAHAIVTPHVLEYVFEQVDGRREVLATALDVPEGADTVEGIVTQIRRLSTALELPTSLSEVPGPDPEDLPTVAREIAEDDLLANGPPGLEPTIADIESILDRSY